MNIWQQIGSILVILGTLLGCGFCYNTYVAQQEDNGHDEGFTAILVVGGVFFTLLGCAAIRTIFFINGMNADSGIEAALVVSCVLSALDFAAFAASGLPMTLGSWQRYAKRRKHTQDGYRK